MNAILSTSASPQRPAIVGKTIDLMVTLSDPAPDEKGKVIDVSVRSERAELIDRRDKQIRIDPDIPISVSFMFRLKEPGICSFFVELYFELHWLASIKFEQGVST